jgi:hypothetical protein
MCPSSPHAQTGHGALRVEVARIAAIRGTNLRSLMVNLVSRWFVSTLAGLNCRLYELAHIRLRRDRTTKLVLSAYLSARMVAFGGDAIRGRSIRC